MASAPTTEDVVGSEPKDVVAENFGLLIAYLIPGFIALVGVAVVVDEVAAGLIKVAAAESTVGGFFFVLLASLAAGMIVNGLRFATVDQFAPPTPPWDESKRTLHLAALTDLRNQGFRYYQAQAGSALAFVWLYATLEWKYPGMQLRAGVAAVVIAAALLWSARNALATHDTKKLALLGYRPGAEPQAGGGGDRQLPPPTAPPRPGADRPTPSPGTPTPGPTPPRPGPTRPGR